MKEYDCEDDVEIIYSRAAGLYAACIAIMVLINSGTTTNTALNMLDCVIHITSKVGF